MDNTGQQPNLAGDFWYLFLKSNAYRSGMGITRSLQRSVLLGHPERSDPDRDDLPGLSNIIAQAQATDFCTDHPVGESCDKCDKPLETLCTVNDAINLCNLSDQNPLAEIADLMLAVKREDFTAAASAFYAPVGEMPGKLNTPVMNNLDEKEAEELAAAFYENIQAFIDETGMTVADIPDAFEVTAVQDIFDQLQDVALSRVADNVKAATSEAEKQLHKMFTRIEFMRTYKSVLDDITEYPIAGLWCTRKSLTKAIRLGNSTVRIDQKTQPTVDRIDPCYLWLTPDWKRTQHGRAIFTLKQVDSTTLAWCRKQNNRAIIHDAIDEVQTANANGYRLASGHLFVEDLIPDGTYDVLVGRGRFAVEAIAEYVDIDSTLDGADWADCEVWMINQKVVYVDLLPEWVSVIGGYGVYLTRFRNHGDSIWGRSLNDFVRPFALMFAGALDAINTSVAKTQGSIVAVDLSVIENPDQQLNLNPKTGEVEMDLSGDTVIPFDSSMAIGTHNFKGKPVIIDKFPTDLAQLERTIAAMLTYMELFSGIPRILTTGTPESSAVRTDDSFETAHRSARKKPAAILEDAKTNVLLPAIRFFYYAGIDMGALLPKFLSDYPDVMLDERLAQWFKNQRNVSATLSDIGPFAAQLPPSSLASLVNKVAEVNGVEGKLIADANPVATANTGATPPADI